MTLFVLVAVAAGVVGLAPAALADASGLVADSTTFLADIDDAGVYQARAKQIVAGLVHRKVYAEVPPKVEYSLTEAGASLNDALRPLGTWGRERLRREGLEAADVDTSQTAASTTS
jgi:hypothetical protein